MGKKVRHRVVGNRVVCSKCGLGGGTLVKVGDSYQHQDQAMCRLMQLRKK